MFSRKLKLSLVAVMVALFGCSKGSQIGGSGAQITLKVGSTQCFQGMGQKFQDFFNGSGSAADIHTVWSCMSQIVQDFDRLTAEASYDKEDLRRFLAKYFFTDGLSDEVVTTTMRLKQVLAGGTTDAVTKAEIAILLQDLDQIDQATQTLAPFTGVLFNSANATVSDAQWNQSYQTFGGLSSTLSPILTRMSQVYAFSEAQAAINAWSDQLSLAPDHFMRKIGKLVPTIAGGKVLLIGGAAASMQPSEWQPLLSTLAKAFSYYRMTVRLTTNDADDVTLALSSPNANWVVQGAIGLLSQAVQARTSQQIPLTEIQTLLDGLNGAGYFSTSFTPDQAVGGLQFLMAKVFPAAKSNPNAIDQYHVVEMQKLLTRWQAVETALEQNRFPGLPDFNKALHPGWGLALDSSGRLQIPTLSGGGVVFREYSALYTVIEWLGQKWGTWPLAQTNFQTLVSDGVNLLHSFNLLQSTDATIYLRLLREANLFMPSANGDMKLDLSEGFQYALFVLSSYRGSHALQTAVGKQCRVQDYHCFQNYLLQNRQQLLSNFPHLNAWLDADPNVWPTYAQDLATIVGDGQWLMQFMVLHYIETFEQRWDQSGDNLIQLNEALAAFPVFQPILDSMFSGVGLAADDTKPMYTFLFAYGETPFSMYGGSVRYLYWKWHVSSWQFSADRKTLAGILEGLAKL